MLRSDHSAEQGAARSPAGTAKEREEQGRDSRLRLGVCVRPQDERRRVSKDRDHDDSDWTDSVSEGAPDRTAGDADERRGREEERGEVGRESTHVVQVDNKEGQRETLARAGDEGASEIPSKWASDAAAKVSRNE